MSTIPPVTPPSSEAPGASEPATDPSALMTSLPSAPASPGDPGRNWITVIIVVLVLGSACAMLFTGHEVHEALLLAGGVTLLGVAIARRILTDGGLLPTIVIACAVTAFAVILVIRDYQLSDVAVIAGGAGLFVSEVIARVVGSGPGRGV